jgi:PEP-CTERM motif
MTRTLRTTLLTTGLALSTLGAAMLSVPATVSAAPIFPTPNPPANSLQFGDFSVYSLALLNFLDNGSTNNSGPFAVQSSPGQISGDVVAMTGASGNPVNTNFAGMDNAFASSTGSTAFFSTGTATEPGQVSAFTGDLTGSWDSRTSALRTYLDGQSQHDLVFYFNLNETGDSDTLDGIDLLLWAKVVLHDDANVLPDKVFYLTGNPLLDNGASGKAQSVALGGPTPDPVDVNDIRWATVHGRICVDTSSGSLIHLGGCTANDANGTTINQNLGANDAAFAAFNEELSDLVNDENSGYDVLQADFRVAKINNGFEQVFIKASTVTPPDTEVPEPATLAMFGLGLASLGFAARRRRR